MSEFQKFVDDLVGQDDFLRYARKYRMNRACVQIPRMAIRQDIIRAAGEATEAADQRPVTWSILELNATTKLDPDDLEASRALVLKKAKEVIEESFVENGRIPHLARSVKNVDIDGTTYRMPMNNLVFGVFQSEDGMFYFDILVQEPGHVVKF